MVRPALQKMKCSKRKIAGVLLVTVAAPQNVGAMRFRQFLRPQGATQPLMLKPRLDECKSSTDPVSVVKIGDAVLKILHKPEPNSGSKVIQACELETTTDNERALAKIIGGNKPQNLVTYYTDVDDTPIPQEVVAYINKHRGGGTCSPKDKYIKTKACTGDLYDLLYHPRYAHARRSDLNFEWKEDLVKKLCKSVFEMHEFGRSQGGIVHCDLKDENVFVNVDGNGNLKDVLIGDFGTACRYNYEDNQLLYAGKIVEKANVGTEYITAPEILKGKTLSCVETKKKCDMWSLGILLSQILSKEIGIKYRDPYKGSVSEALFSRNVEDLKAQFKTEDACNLSTRLWEISQLVCKKLLQIDPTQRSSAREFLDEIERLQKPKGMSVRPRVPSKCPTLACSPAAQRQQRAQRPVAAKRAPTSTGDAAHSKKKKKHQHQGSLVVCEEQEHPESESNKTHKMRVHLFGQNTYPS